jgi:Bacterial alpha-L-rhamnosidase 6 hairpin glycosidase domain/Bacterial alpha-L-rhamnosidase C-terminal domain
MNVTDRARGRARHVRARAFIVVVAAVVAAGSGTAAATVGSAPAGTALTAVTEAQQVTPAGSLGLPALSDASQYILAPSSRTVRATRVTESTPADDDYVQAGDQVSEVDAHQLGVGTSTTTQTDGVTVRQAGEGQSGGYFSYMLHAPAGQPVTIRVEEAGSATSDYWVLVNGTKVYHREAQPKQSGVWDGLAGLVHYEFTVPAAVVGANAPAPGEFTLTFQNSGTPGDGAQIAAVWASTRSGQPQSPYGGTAAHATTSGVTLTSNLFGKPYAILDFGHEVGGQVQFTARSSGQATIGLAFSESWEYMTSASDFSEDPAGVATETHYLSVADGTSQVTDPVIRGGFRYLMVFLDSPGSVTISGLTLHFTPDPTAANLRAYQGSFLSSDTTLNKLWYAGAYTVQMDTIDPTTGRAYPAEPGEVQNNATVAEGPTAITDGAKRDRLDWVGDQSVEDPVAYLTTGNQQAALDSLDFMAQGANADGQIPGVYLPSSGYNDGWGEYAAWWVRNYLTYYLYSGDKATLDKWFPAMQKDVAWLTSLVGSNGLLNVPSGESGQWGYGNSGEETYENALYVWTLQAAEQVADAENDPSLAAQYTSDAATTTAAVNANLWDASAGAYIVEPGNTAHPQDGDVMAVLAGIATGQRETDVLSFLKTQWTPYGADTIDESGNIVDQYVSPFISYYELLAYADQNTSQGTADAMNLMMRTWPHMLSGDASGTFWENVSLSGAPQLGAYTSLSHGWSAGVVPFLSNVLLGVTPDSGGFGNFTVLPHPASGVTWAEGKVPTPQGDITSAWKQTSTGLSLAVTAPSGTTYTAGVPDGSNATVSLNGQVVWAGGKAAAPDATDSGGYIQVSGLTGTVTLGETR